MKLLRHLFNIVIVIATLAIGVLFALQNKTPVSLDLLVYTFDPKSLALWILAALATGGLIGMLISSARSWFNERLALCGTNMSTLLAR